MGKDMLFRPTDAQLVNHYLKKNVLGEAIGFGAISELNVYEFAPWDLPYKSCSSNDDLKWYFFCPVEKKYGRKTRATEYGYWNHNGEDNPIYHNFQVVGTKKTLMFYPYKDNGCGGDQTYWFMHEYRLKGRKDGYVLCVVEKVDDVVSRMIGEYAVNKAMAFNEKHRFTSIASAKITSLDQKIGFTERFRVGTTMVNDKMREVDRKFQVSEKTKSVLAAAKQSTSNTGSAIMKNTYLSNGASWVTAAYNRVANATKEDGHAHKSNPPRECSATLQKRLPPKLADPGKFRIPCTISNRFFKGLCDTGAVVNLMPLSLYKKLGLGELKPTSMTFLTANRSPMPTSGVVEDVIVKVGRLLFPTNFIIADIREDEEVPMIFGRPFLATARALIDVQNGEVTLRVEDEHVKINMLSTIKLSD